MKLHELKADKGARRKRTRVGRGIAAGKGRYAGRGIKGTGARTGGGVPNYFEGGQLPLVRRLPFKRGFTNIFRVEHQEVNIGDLDALFEAGAVIGGVELARAGLLRDASQPVVILNNGELTKPLTVKAHRFSKTALAALEKAGGAGIKLELLVKGAHATVKKLRKEDLAKLAEKAQQ